MRIDSKCNTDLAKAYLRFIVQSHPLLCKMTVPKYKVLRTTAATIPSLSSTGEGGEL